ncbi:polysaccharide pyruvyl transferase family protein [Oscillatoria sp. CS-180]|uniref:polysaccharide pyruvyl transferase family protein n=1 Tax=Oscillatoria sp. CS-180 TaxID=3021720 RepID=UPI00232F5DDB|nr:polysaccharide pyruvyl transferase family protein [Oscillatoria sp. CS-180]MDB9525403.1 polysaccharide pyruvyl transferase family protein [Oscillatoria sp. CS-180]
MLKVLLVNDTSSDVNPGCKATVSSLKSLIHSATEYDTHIHSWPCGFGYEHFESLHQESLEKELSLYPYLKKKLKGNLERTNQKLEKLIQKLSKKKSWDYSGRKIDLVAWSSSVRKFEEYLFNEVCSANEFDIVVINAEGTVHHNQIGAITIASIIKIFSENKPVWCVNGSWQAIDEQVVCKAISSADYITAREPMSFRWLSNYCEGIIQSADCAFLSNIFNPSSFLLPSEIDSEKACLYTPGVLAQPSSSSVNPLKVQEILEHLHIIRRLGWQPVCLLIDELHLIPFLKDAEVSIVFAKDIGWKTFGEFIRRFKLVISGRYHILIFSALAKVPFVPIASNTWKIEGLMELLGLDNSQIVYNPKDIVGWLSKEKHNTSIRIATKELQNCKRLACFNIPKIVKK